MYVLYEFSFFKQLFGDFVCVVVVFDGYFILNGVGDGLFGYDVKIVFFGSVKQIVVCVLV